MTPDQIAERLFRYQAAARSRGAYTDCACPSEDDVADAIAEACGAALRERDARWAAAVKASGLMLSPDSDNEAWKPLRALLEEAGK